MVGAQPLPHLLVVTGCVGDGVSLELVPVQYIGHDPVSDRVVDECCQVAEVELVYTRPHDFAWIDPVGRLHTIRSAVTVPSQKL